MTPPVGSTRSRRDAGQRGLLLVAIVAGGALCVYLAVWGRRYGLDLRVYRASVTAWLDGRDPYLLSFTGSHLPFTYPPFALAVLSSLTWGSFVLSQWLLWGLSVAATAAAVAIVLEDRGFAGGPTLWCGSFAWACVSMIALEPARSGVDYGQVEFVLLFLVVADLLVVPSYARGIATGVAAAIKLTPLLFVVVFLVRREWRSACRALGSFAACTGIAWLLWPHLSHEYWHQDVIHPARVGTVSYGGNQSWYAVVHRPPFPTAGSTPAWLVLSLATAVVGTFVAWRCVDTRRQSFAIVAVALGGLLISPISWTHHWIWVILIPPMLVGPRRHETEQVVRTMLWGIVALTVITPYWWVSTGGAGDALDAVLPAWTFLTLLVWSAVELRGWRHRGRAEPVVIERSPIPTRW